jgi:hypothetical protein
MPAVSSRLSALAGLLPLALMMWTSAALAQCVEPSFDAYEAARFTVRRVQVLGPLVGRSTLVDLVGRQAALKPGAPFTAAAIVRGQEAIRDALRNTTAPFESPVHVTVVTRTVSNCDTGARELDVVYEIFSTKLRVTGVATSEPRRGTFDEPVAAQSVASATARFQLSPMVRYNAAEHLVGGARASWVLPGVFDVFEAEVQASSSASYADIRFSGERLAERGWLRGADWRLAFTHAQRPAERETLKTQALVAHVAAVTRPIGSSDAVFRFASAVEGGRQRSSREPVASASSGGFGHWKNAVNLHAHFPRQTLSASYGVQLAFTSGRPAVDYSKHIVDVSYDARVGPARGWWAHRQVDLVARLGAGALGGEGSVPAAELFLGGNVDVPFLTTPGWTIRGTPVLRSYPAYQLNAPTPFRRGGDGFVAFNVTAGLPFWFRPLAPAEIANDHEITQLLEGQLTSAESALEVVHKSADPAHRAIAERMPQLGRTLAAMQDRVSVLASTLSGTSKASADECDEQIDTLLATVAASKYLGFLAEASEDDVSLPSLRRACSEELNTQLRDGELEELGKEIDTTIAFVQQRLEEIDTAAARRRAQKDMRLPRRTVNAVLQELNAVSIGPVLMLDAVRLSEREPVLDEPIYVGIGTGLRVSVVNTLHLSAGYSWNVARSGGERHGAGFAVLEFTTLLGR